MYDNLSQIIGIIFYEVNLMMKKTNKPLGTLSAVELELMEAIWASPTPITVAALVHMFEDSRGWKTSTVSTMLERMIAKGFLEKTAQGKTNHYTPIATLKEYQAQEGQEILSTLYNGSIVNFVAALVDDGNINQKDIQELSDWFKTIE